MVRGLIYGVNEFEQANILYGVVWAAKSRQDILTEKFVLDLHKHMFGEIWKWAGIYRTSDKNIGCPYWDVPMRVMELLKNTQAMMAGLSTTSDEITVRFHHRLVSIHPFSNGNGRHSSLMADLLMNHLGGESLQLGWAG